MDLCHFKILDALSNANLFLKVVIGSWHIPLLDLDPGLPTTIFAHPARPAQVV